jgi:type IV pilus assembly protein PilQ
MVWGIFLKNIKLLSLLLFFTLNNGISQVDERPLSQASQGSQKRQFKSKAGKGIKLKIDRSKLITLDCYNADIRDVLRTLAEQQGINIVTHQSVRGRVSLRLSKVPFEVVLKTLLEAYDFTWEVKDNIYVVKRAPRRKILDIKASPEKLTLNVKNADVREVLNEISKQAGLNIILDSSVRGTLSGNLKDVPLEEGLRTLLSSYGFSIVKSKGIYKVMRRGISPLVGPEGEQLNVIIEDNLVSIEAKDVLIERVIKEIFLQADLNFIAFGTPRGRVTTKFHRFPLDKALSFLLKSTSFKIGKKDGVYLLADKKLAKELLVITEVIPVKHLKAEDALKLVSQTQPEAKVVLIPEQNSLSVTGSSEAVERAREFLAEVDIPSPQVMIEALVVELSEIGAREIGIHSGKYQQGRWGEGDMVTVEIPALTFTYQPLGNLTRDFFLKLQALIEEKKGEIKANPKVATLNGQEAVINIGWYTFYQTTGGTVETPIYTTHRLSTGILLRVKPFITAEGEIICQIQPSVSSSPTKSELGYPEVSETSVSTTLRLKDGESVVIGGLIQAEKRKVMHKIPLLGSIPILGWLFRKTAYDTLKKELIISITPRILPVAQVPDLKE